MTLEQENIQLRQQLLGAYIRMHYLEMTAISSQLSAALAHEQVKQIANEIPGMIRKHSEEQRLRLHKLTQDATEIVNMLDKKGKLA